MEHYHYIVSGFMHEDKEGRLLDVATIDVFAETEGEALVKAQKLVEKKHYRVASVVTHDNEKCTLVGN
jgi:hypothetical protein